MFSRQKKENTKVLQHKLYLAREAPDLYFDLSDCGINNVPKGVYSLCLVFLKEELNLRGNYLHSLEGGGDLKDLHQLKILDLQNNAFTKIPNEIELLSSLTELYLASNKLRTLPDTLSNLRQLRILDVSNNRLMKLPENFGNLTSLNKLNLSGNTSLARLPKSFCKLQELAEIEVDYDNFEYPPAIVVAKGIQSIQKYISDDTGFDGSKYEKLKDLSEEEVDCSQIKLEYRKASERPEFKILNDIQMEKEQLLLSLVEDQKKLAGDINKIHQLKEVERRKFVEQLQEIENNVNDSITKLLTLNKKPLIELEKEEEETEKLLNAALSQDLKKEEILHNMQEMLRQETEKLEKYACNRNEIAFDILKQEYEIDSTLTQILHTQDFQKSDLLIKLQEDEELQKAAVAVLIERGNSHSWSLIQQVRLIESQLKNLTDIELNKKETYMDKHTIELAEMRLKLSAMLMEILQKQKEHRNHLFNTLTKMENKNKSLENYWLLQYQQLIQKMPTSVREIQNDMDPYLLKLLLMADVINYIPSLSQLMNKISETKSISKKDLINVGITDAVDQNKILEAFEQYFENPSTVAPSAPYLDEASAPPLLQEDDSETFAILETECIVCMNGSCEIIFIPCGHLCSCFSCSNQLEICPLCRTSINQKICVYKS